MVFDFVGMRMHETDPFPLSLLTCNAQKELRSYAHQTIQLAKLNYSNRIGGYLAWNLGWLENQGGWSQMEGQFKALASIARNAPAADCIKLEREAAHLAMNNLAGIGPKQSRNLWICLGLARYETPLDARVMKWFKERLAPFIESKNLCNGSRCFPSTFSR